MTKPMTYADAGVDIDKANALVERIKNIAKSTHTKGVMGEIGGFGGLFSLSLTDLTHPVLVSSTDGVGTKLKIAFMMNRHDSIGIDLVAMCVNDVAVQGAKPLFFLDYLSIGELETRVASDIIKGVGDGCRQAECALIGGETAEMPGLYQKGEYDLAGFTVGIVDRSKILDGSKVNKGDKLIGIASSGLHSNGYSLVRKICFEVLGLKCEDYLEELNQTLGEVLLTPTRIYTRTLVNLVDRFPVHGLAHITGGGIEENILRVIPDGCGVMIRKDSWEIPPVFEFIRKAGHISFHEMMRTFNNGIGMVVVTPEHAAQSMVNQLNQMQENAYLIGEVIHTQKSGTRMKWV